MGPPGLPPFIFMVPLVSYRDAMTDNDTSARPRCPHCDHELERWATPPESTWGEGWQWVCFNDDCSYFVKGWTWMAAQYNVRSSYRFRLDPVSGETGPLPVWSTTALKSGILAEEESLQHE